MSNTLKWDDLLKRATELGEQHGRGKDTQVKFLMSAVEGGYFQVLDIGRDKHGPGIDDAQKLAEAYVKAQSGATTFDAKATNQRKLMSCVRKCIELGLWPKGGGGEPLGTVNNLISHRQALRKNPSNAKKLDDAANTLMRFAREQLKRDLLIDPAEFDTFCYRKVADQKTQMEDWEQLRKHALRMTKGQTASGAIDGSAELKSIVDLANQRIKKLAIEERDKYTQAKAQPETAELAAFADS